MNFLFVITFTFSVVLCKDVDILSRCRVDDVNNAKYSYKTVESKNEACVVSTLGNLKIGIYEANIKLYLSESISGNFIRYFQFNS